MIIKFERALLLIRVPLLLKILMISKEMRGLYKTKGLESKDLGWVRQIGNIVASILNDFEKVPTYIIE